MTAAAEPVEVRPQEGPQEQFLASEADIVVYGGMAGGGKSWALLYDPLRYILPSDEWGPHGVRGFTGVIFRRTSPMIRNEGGLWDESMKLYSQFDGKPRETVLEWVFPQQAGQTVRFPSMQHESDKFDWQGAQIPYIGFDELTHFEEEQFFYLLSRNRSDCGIKPYIRATTNPDADSWVADFISWWIDQEEFLADGETDNPRFGLPIPARTGVLRYFIRQLGVLKWASTPEELFEYIPQDVLDQGVDPLDMIKSLTFIPASVYDNKKLLRANPEYLANLLALPLVERERLLGGNWKIRPSSGNVFNRAWWVTVDMPPDEGYMKVIRYWDKAGTAGVDNPKAAWTVGVKMGKDRLGRYYVLDVTRKQVSTGDRKKLMRDTAKRDGKKVRIWVEQEPGSGGKESAQNSVADLAGYIVKVDIARSAPDDVKNDRKLFNAFPYASQVENGNVHLVRAAWNRAYVDEHHAFPLARIKDQVDASSGAFAKLAKLKATDPDDFEPVTR